MTWRNVYEPKSLDKCKQKTYPIIRASTHIGDTQFMKACHNIWDPSTSDKGNRYILEGDPFQTLPSERFDAEALNDTLSKKANVGFGNWFLNRRKRQAFHSDCVALTKHAKMTVLSGNAWAYSEPRGKRGVRQAPAVQEASEQGRAEWQQNFQQFAAISYKSFQPTANALPYKL